MSRIYHDRLVGDLRVPSRRELRARSVAFALEARGIDPMNVRCACCGLRLVDLPNIKLSADGPIGPECSKPGHAFPCRHKIGVPVQRS
jgi:hypothetical protein